MSMILDLFGDQIYNWSVETVKQYVKNLTTVQAERRSYLLHEFSRLTGKPLTEQDFDDVDGIPQKGLDDIERNVI